MPFAGDGENPPCPSAFLIDFRASGLEMRRVGRVHKLAGYKAVGDFMTESSSALAMAPFMPLAPSVSFQLRAVGLHQLAAFTDMADTMMMQ